MKELKETNGKIVLAMDYLLKTGWGRVEGCSTPQVAILLRNNLCKDDFCFGLLHVETTPSSLSALMCSILSFHSSFTSNLSLLSAPFH